MGTIWTLLKQQYRSELLAVIPLLPSFDKLIEVWWKIRPLDISLDQTRILKEKGGGKK
jgi:hypothetical protein